jgi:predicted nuclease of predicted toxin-antitoxin system
LVVVTADADFGMLLALRRTSNPSVVHVRNVGELVPEQHAVHKSGIADPGAEVRREGA